MVVPDKSNPSSRRMRPAAIVVAIALFLMGLLQAVLFAYAMLVHPDLLPLAIVSAMALDFALIAGFVVTNAVRRWRKGKCVFSTPRLDDAVFTERWTSGRGHKTSFLPRVGASNCLWLSATSNRLLVGLMFPFNLFWIPEWLGVEYDIPLADIMDLTPKPQRFGRSVVTIRFRLEGDAEHEIDLAVRDMDGFMSAVNRRQETFEQ